MWPPFRWLLRIAGKRGNSQASSHPGEVSKSEQNYARMRSGHNEPGFHSNSKLDRNSVEEALNVRKFAYSSRLESIAYPRFALDVLLAFARFYLLSKAGDQHS